MHMHVINANWLNPAYFKFYSEIALIIVACVRSTSLSPLYHLMYYFSSLVYSFYIEALNFLNMMCVCFVFDFCLLWFEFS